MPSVPNWIAKAVVYTPRTGGEGDVRPITSWRATQTQVVVTVDGREMRFYLDGLHRLGDRRGYSAVRLMAPDDPEAISARRSSLVQAARSGVLVAVGKQRLQDSTDDAEATLVALVAIRDAVNAALASLEPVL